MTTFRLTPTFALFAVLLFPLWSLVTVASLSWEIAKAVTSTITDMFTEEVEQ